MFPCFGDAGTKLAIEAELQEFGDGVRAEPDRGRGPETCSSSPSC